MTKNQDPSNAEVLQQIQALESHIQDLKELMREQCTPRGESPGVKFLLAEFKHVGEFWRHTDSRLETGINIYLTISAVAVSVLVLHSRQPQQDDDRKLLLGTAVLVALALLVAGIILAGRIVGTSLLKAEYLQSLNLVRRFFADKDPGIAPYLSLPLADVPKAIPELRPWQPRPPLFQRFLLAIHVWDGMLLGFAVSAGIWLVMPTASIALIAAPGLVAAVSCTVVLTVRASRQMKRTDKI